MRVKLVNRYYCDFCRKANCSSSGMRLHEQHCTMNPNRSCRMCKCPRDILALVRQLPSTPSFYGEHGEEVGTLALARIRTICGTCPACMLAVIRQSGNVSVIPFIFQDEAKAWFSRPGIEF